MAVAVKKKRVTKPYRSKNPRVRTEFSSADWDGANPAIISVDLSNMVCRVLGNGAVPAVRSAIGTYQFLLKIEEEQPRYSEMMKAAEKLQRALDATYEALSRKQGIDSRTRQYMANVMATEM